MSDFISPDYMAQIQEKMNGDTDFTITIRRSGGVKESCYYSPVTCGDVKWWALEKRIRMKVFTRLCSS